MDELTQERITTCAALIPYYIREEGIRPDSCILQSRIALDVLERFDISAIEIPVNVMIFNAAYSKRVEEGRACKTDQELIEASRIDGSYAVGIGIGPVNTQFKGYRGHLIIGHPNRGWIMDPSIQQANRPQYNICLRPIVVQIEPEFFKGRDRSWFVSENCALGYQTINNPLYKTAPDWNMRKYRRDIVQDIVGYMKRKGL